MKASDPIAYSVVGIVTESVLNDESKVKTHCTGALILSNVVLTAAHCLVDSDGNDLPTESILIFFGLKESEADRKNLSRKVLRIQIHPEWRRNEISSFNDLAKIELDQPAPLPYVPLSIDESPHVLSVLEIAGYGIWSILDSENLGVLRRAQISIDSYSAQDLEFKVQTNGHASTCEGDSGGPAYILKNGKPYLVGVASRGDEGCQEYQTFENISAQMNFLRSTISARVN